MKSGQFVTGDWWVVGPVTVVSVTPSSTAGPLAGEVNLQDAVNEAAKNIKGFMHFNAVWLPAELRVTGDNRHA